MHHAVETVTYYALGKDGRAVSRLVLRGVSWHAKTVSSATDKGALLSQVIVCRIPIEKAPEDFTAKESDMLVRGECTAENLSEAELKHKYGAATVKAVSDNRTGLTPHWKLEAV